LFSMGISRGLSILTSGFPQHFGVRFLFLLDE
jgi:hypothetical protein